MPSEVPGRVFGGALVFVLGALLVACGGDDDAPDGDASAADTSAVVAELARYVALGDSFSSGTGAPPYDQDEPRCQRSDVGWPHLLDLQLDEIEDLDLRACGGATVDDLLEQIDAATPDRAEEPVGLVTLTIGGNDVGFGELVTQCVLADCSQVAGGAAFTASLESLGDRLTNEVYPALRAAFPDARILHVGYPRLTPASGPVGPECGWLAPEEQPATVALVDALNASIAAAANAAATAAAAGQATYVDVGGAFAGHELCTADAWVNPISFEPERAHPTAAGYDALALTVAAAL